MHRLMGKEGKKERGPCAVSVWQAGESGVKGQPSFLHLALSSYTRSSAGVWHMNQPLVL